MGEQATKVLSPEQERQQFIEALCADEGPEWADQYKPGSFGCHELLDRTAFVVDAVEQYVRTHPACVRNEDWFILADQAAAALHQLYQRIGEEHL